MTAHKAEPAGHHAATSQPIAASQGTPVTFATTVQAPTPAPANPLMIADNWMPFLLLIAAVAGVVGLFTKHITGKLADFEKAHRPVHESLERDFKTLEHKVNNERSRVDQLERSRSGDVERIVKLETQLHSIEKGQERIEHALEKMAADLGKRIDGWAEQFSASIREVRDVKRRD